MTRAIRPLLALALVSALSACGQAPVAPLAPAVEAASASASAKSLSAKAKALFKDVFEHYDTTNDKRWTGEDFDLPEDRFLNLFGKTDADDDHIVTWEEYYSDERHEELVLHSESRARVASAGVGGHVNLEKVYFMMDGYLQQYLNKRERRKHLKAAFATCDANDDKRLNLGELAHLHALMDAKSDELYIQKRVNRSKGQKG